VKKLYIDDLPEEARQRVLAQMAAENPAPKPTPKQTKRVANPTHWQGKEPDFHRVVEHYLGLIGFAKRNKSSIIGSLGRGGRMGWQIHISRAIGNPYLLDILLLDHKGRYLELELKTAKGRLTDIQAAILTGKEHLVCRCTEDVEAIVRDWLRNE